MTYLDAGSFGPPRPLVRGKALDAMRWLSDRLKNPGQIEYLVSEGRQSTSERTPLQKSLFEAQSAVSGVSMHLPPGFALGLNRQFANLFDEDAWETVDQLPNLETVKTFLAMLIATNTTRRPGIGTNGRGSISSFWLVEGNSLTVESLPSGRTAWVLTRIMREGEIERAAGDCAPNRLGDVLHPYNSEVWFDQ
jgi:hypothetical protein